MRTKELKKDDLKKFAEQFILDLAVPSVLGLKGNLGSGKTTLVKSFIRALGVEEKVTSPTFNIVRTYKKEELTIYHVDLYRLSSIHEFYDLDLPLNEEGTLFFIEWSDMIPESKSNGTLIYGFKYQNHTTLWHSDLIMLVLRVCDCKGPHKVKLGGNYGGEPGRRQFSRKGMKVLFIKTSCSLLKMSLGTIP